MKQVVRLGRIFGVDVGLHASVLLIAALLVWLLAYGELPLAAPHESPAAYWLAGGAGALLFLASLLAHEFAHAVLARRYGMQVKGITLWLLGGVADLGGDMPSPTAAWRIAAIGPGVSALLAAVFGGLTFGTHVVGGPDLVAGLFAWLALVNGMLAVFNLLPGIPLDGGRVLRALMWRRSSDAVGSALKAAKAGRWLGQGLAIVGIAEALFYSAVSGLWLAMIGWFLLGAADAEARVAVGERAVRRFTVGQAMTPEAPLIAGSLRIQDLLDLQLGHRHSDIWVVTDPAGRPEGVLSLSRLAGMPADARARLTLADLAHVGGDLETASPDDPLAGVLPRLGDRSGVLVVDAQGAPVGVLTPADVRRIMELGPLVGAGAP